MDSQTEETPSDTEAARTQTYGSQSANYLSVTTTVPLQDERSNPPGVHPGSTLTFIGLSLFFECYGGQGADALMEPRVFTEQYYNAIIIFVIDSG